MPRFDVRVWVDLRITADSEADAKKVAHKHPINVPKATNCEVYDMQVSGEVWPVNEENYE